MQILGALLSIFCSSLLHKLPRQAGICIDLDQDGAEDMDGTHGKLHDLRGQTSHKGSIQQDSLVKESDRAFLLKLLIVSVTGERLSRASC
jgi:hypothetical protein